LFAVAQFRLPLLTPVGAQSARHDHADQRDQPELRLQMNSSGISHSAFHGPQSNHSSRNAAIGSTRAALRAGRYPAKAATLSSSNVAAAIVDGSFGLNPKSKVEAVCVAASDANSPTATPATTSANASRNTSQMTFPRRAPSAIRMPISFVRRATA